MTSNDAPRPGPSGSRRRALGRGPLAPPEREPDTGPEPSPVREPGPDTGPEPSPVRERRPVPSPYGGRRPVEARTGRTGPRADGCRKRAAVQAEAGPERYGCRAGLRRRIRRRRSAVLSRGTSR
ncbi:hypothetical protein SFUMM280S_01930 [Streptomyces fumanus]